MAVRADALNPWAWTLSGLDSSPLARILTGTPLRLPRPLAASSSSVTSAPLSKRASRSSRFTGCVCVRNGSKGIDFFMCGPRSLRIRMWIGIWPPSKFTRLLEPEREPAPFWPRPDVLPVPEPSPRPTRLRALRLPGAGLSVWSPKSSELSEFSVIDPHQVADAVQHAARLRGVLDVDRVADAAQPQRAQRVELLLVRAVLAFDLRHLHDAGASSAASVVPFDSPVGAPSSVSVAARSPPRPSTWLIDRPRSSATSSGVRRDCRPWTVAFTRLIGFCEPSDLLRMSWMPASSRTARTPPPAMTPWPSEAGWRKTLPEPNSPVTVWVIVEPCFGTRNRFFFARSTPFWIASGTSFALPYPTPTTSFSSPTTTRAVNEKRRPPLTTFATRLISTTRSCRSSPPALTVRSTPFIRSVLLRARRRRTPSLFRDTGTRRGRTRRPRRPRPSRARRAARPPCRPAPSA